MQSETPRTIYKPLYDHIVILRDEAVKQINGILLPEGSKTPPNTGTVIAVGEGRLSLTLPNQTEDFGCHVEPLRLKIGDRVVFHSYAGSELEDPHLGKKILLCQEDDVLAIIEKEVSHVGSDPQGQESQEPQHRDGSSPLPAAN